MSPETNESMSNPEEKKEAIIDLYEKIGEFLREEIEIAIENGGEDTARRRLEVVTSIIMNSPDFSNFRDDLDLYCEGRRSELASNGVDVDEAKERILVYLLSFYRGSLLEKQLEQAKRTRRTRLTTVQLLKIGGRIPYGEGEVARLPQDRRIDAEVIGFNHQIRAFAEENASTDLSLSQQEVTRMVAAGLANNDPSEREDRARNLVAGVATEIALRRRIQEIIDADPGLGDYDVDISYGSIPEDMAGGDLVVSIKPNADRAASGELPRIVLIDTKASDKRAREDDTFDSSASIRRSSDEPQFITDGRGNMYDVRKFTVSAANRKEIVRFKVVPDSSLHKMSGTVIKLAMKK